MRYVSANIKNNYNTSSTIGSIGTETQNITDSSPSLTTLLQKGGFVFGGNNYTQEAFDSLKNRNLKNLLFIIKENQVDFTKQDENKNTILHLLIDLYSESNEVNLLIKHILEKDNVNNFINMQNDKGDTPLHIAVKKKNHELAGLLIEHGANVDIENNDGFKIESENDESYTQTDVSDIQSILMQTNSPDDVTEMETSPITDSDKKLYDTVAFINSIRDSTDAFLKSLKQPSDVMIKTITETPAPNVVEQKGGFVSGKRIMKTYSNMSFSESTNFSSIKTSTSQFGGKSSEQARVESIKTNDINDIYDDISQEEDNESNEDMRELSRLIKNQTDEIHERVVLKIMEIMNVPRDMAENYKSSIYRRVKTEKPELNGFDRAVEMEKLATRENLELVDIQAYSEERERYLKEYREKKQLEKPKEKKQKKVVETPTESSSQTPEEKPKKKTAKKETKKATKKTKK